MIAVLGSLNIDSVARVARLPMPGETVSASAYTQSLGGKGANQAIAAARAGSSVEFLGRVGIDPAGDALVAALESAGVETEHILRDPAGSTGAALISVDRHGENTIVVVPGVNGHVRKADVDAAQDVIERSAILLLQLEIPLETVRYAAGIARQSDTTVILNPSPAQELPRSLLNMVDILVPNEEEIAYLSGMGSPVDPTSAAGMLCANGVKAVVVTLGHRGAALVSEGGETDIPAHEVEATDTTGAGDAFVGNLAAALDGGRTLAESASFACAAAALSVQHAGTQAAMPTREQTNALLASKGVS